MNKNTALALGIPSAFVIIGGIILSIVLYLLTSNIVEGINEGHEKPVGLNQTGNNNFNVFSNDKIAQLHDSPQSAHYRSERSNERDSSVFASTADYPLWIAGVVYIFPGLLGLVSAIFQKRGWYITSIIFSLLVLLLMAIATAVSLFFIFFAALAFSIVSDNCYDEDGSCKCRGSSESYNLFKSCSYFKTVYSLCMCIMFFLVFSWVALLVMLVMCCYYTCCAKNQGTSGVVLNPAQQPMISSNQGDPAYTQQTYQYPPPQQYFDEKAPSKV